jgi:thioredoxin reductase (NADPH)
LSLKKTTAKDSKLSQLRIVNNQAGAEENLQMDGAFIFIGLVPNTAFLEGSNILLDRWGFVVSGHAILHGDHRPIGFENRDPLLLETSVPGVFAAGDVRDTSTKQVVSAAGEGSTAALMVREYLKNT